MAWARALVIYTMWAGERWSSTRLILSPMICLRGLELLELLHWLKVATVLALIIPVPVFLLREEPRFPRLCPIDFAEETHKKFMEFQIFPKKI